MKKVELVGLIVLSFLAPAAGAQFARSFEVPAAGSVSTYYWPSHLAAQFQSSSWPYPVVYLFLDKDIGERITSLSVPNREIEAVLSPERTEVVTSSSQVIGSGIRGTHFSGLLGRYHARTGKSISFEKLTIPISANDNAELESALDGTFLLRNRVDNTRAGVNFVAKYGPSDSNAVELKWASSLNFPGHNSHLETASLPDGETGYLFRLLGVDNNGNLTATNVVGLLSAVDGSAKWGVVVRTATSQSETRETRFCFGMDGSLFATHVTRSIWRIWPSDSILAARLNSDGLLAYSKRIKIPAADFVREWYFDGRALLCFVTSERDRKLIHLLALDESGEIVSNTSLDCDFFGPAHGRGARISAARHDRSDFVFLRFKSVLNTGAPEDVLARLSLRTGAIDLHSVPETAGSELLEIATTPRNDPVSRNTYRTAYAALTSALFSRTSNQITFYGIPPEGGFPHCLVLAPSAIGLRAPPRVESETVLFIDLANRATVRAMGVPEGEKAFNPPFVRPAAPLETDRCGAPEITFQNRGSQRAELRIPTGRGFHYIIERASQLGNWTAITESNGTGGSFTHEVPLDEGAVFYRVVRRPATRQ